MHVQCRIHAIRHAAGPAVIIQALDVTGVVSTLPVISKDQTEPKRALHIGDSLLTWRQSLPGTMLVLAEGEGAISRLCAAFADNMITRHVESALEAATKDFAEVNSQDVITRHPGHASRQTTINRDKLLELTSAATTSDASADNAYREVPAELIELIDVAA